MDDSAAIADPERRLEEARVVLRRSEAAREAAERALRENAGIEAALREGETRHRRPFEAMNEGFVVGACQSDDTGETSQLPLHRAQPGLGAAVRPQGRGHARHVDPGKSITEILPLEDARYWIEAFGSVLPSGVPARFEHRVAALDR